MTSGLSIGHLSFLTFQAVAQVVVICLCGFWAAKSGILTPEGQKHVSRINVDLFTPALIFSKLAPSLSIAKLVEISVIPIFYAVTTGVSYISSIVTSRLLRLNVPESNFVTAMAVFGNSNSLPVSLTISLAYTLPNLLWDSVPNDSPDKVASRGVLYLLIFQQLGQMLRWSWGYNKLLRKLTPAERAAIAAEDGTNDEEALVRNAETICGTRPVVSATTPLLEGPNGPKKGYGGSEIVAETESPAGSSSSSSASSVLSTLSAKAQSYTVTADEFSSSASSAQIPREPLWRRKCREILNGILAYMNPPLYSMLVSIAIASVPKLQYEFFEKGGFLQNTVSSAIKQLGSVSIPLILVVLGSNLVVEDVAPASKRYGRIVFGSLVSRMILPSLVLLPAVSLCAKYLAISVLSDPIFLIVAFLLTMSPPAIQLSQICQLNELYEQEMAGVLFWGYVVLTLPSTIAIVVASLKVLDWSM